MKSATLNPKLNALGSSECCATSKTASLPPNSKLKKDGVVGVVGIPFKGNCGVTLGRTQSVRNFLNRVVNQTGSGFRTLRRRAVVQATGIALSRNNLISGGSEAKTRYDEQAEERAAAWKKRFAEDGGKVPGKI